MAEGRESRFAIEPRLVVDVIVVRDHARTRARLCTETINRSPLLNDSYDPSFLLLPPPRYSCSAGSLLARLGTVRVPGGAVCTRLVYGCTVVLNGD